MKVSCLLLVSTARPEPRAVLNTKRFVPKLSKTAYPADFWIAALDAGFSLYRSCRVLAAIFRLLSRFLSGESLALAKLTASSVIARTVAIFLILIGFSLFLTTCGHTRTPGP